MLTSEEQNLILAQFHLGLVEQKCPCGCGVEGWWSNTLQSWYAELPDYGRDFFVIYGAEELLTEEQQQVYCDLTGGQIVESCFPLTLKEAWQLRHAEPRTLRMNLIKAIGKWKE